MIAPILMAMTLATAGTAGIAWAYQANKYERILADQRNTHLKQRNEALEALHAENERLTAQAAQAAAAATERTTKLARDRDALRSAADRLRDQLARASAALPSAAPAATTEYTAALGSVYRDCVANLERLGAQAAGHSNDVRTLLDAWPRAQGN